MMEVKKSRARTCLLAMAAFATVMGSFETAIGSESLRGICPDPIVIQTDWFPTPERAAAYHLVGPGGKIDANNGRY